MQNVNWKENIEIEHIESQPIYHKISTFNNQFNELQLKIINLCKNDKRACTDYAYLYLKLLESQGIIKILQLPNRIISPESSNRIRRQLFENCYDNPDLAFLRKYVNSDNEELNNESKEFYRSN
jgi:hypothetical protein